MNNILINFLDTDSYKFSHACSAEKTMYPPNLEYAMAYIEARKNGPILFFGLQYILENLKVPTKEEIETANILIKNQVGKGIFNKDAWLELSNKGYFPLKIKALPEGTVINSKEVLATVENTEAGFGWLVGWFETILLRVWYPTSVATNSYKIKQVLKSFLEKTGDVSSLDYMLHDFGSRSTTCSEQAGIGGMSHLLNFKGTDTFFGYLYANKFYNALLENLASSIPASEHSTITSWGRANEKTSYENIIKSYGGKGKTFACVTDSYNIWESLHIWKELEPILLEVGGTLVIRPDSGDPVLTPVKTINKLLELFGYTVNDKGYKLLPSHIRVIQGDGVDINSITQILTLLEIQGISANNIAFGMGGALLQNVNRDTYSFAYKFCNVTVNGEDRDVFKAPLEDPTKASKKGKITLNKEKKTVLLNSLTEKDELLRIVYLNGGLVNKLNFDEIKNNID